MFLQRVSSFNPNGIVNHLLDVRMGFLSRMKCASNDAQITRVPSTLHPDLARQHLWLLSAVDPVADEERAPTALALQTCIVDVVRRVRRALLSHSKVRGIPRGQEPVFEIEMPQPSLL